MTLPDENAAGSSVPTAPLGTPRPYPVLCRVVAGALDCIAQGRGGVERWELEEVMDHLELDHPEGFVADLRRLADDIEAGPPAWDF